jgi:hypothetical protein
MPEGFYEVVVSLLPRKRSLDRKVVGARFGITLC